MNGAAYYDGWNEPVKGGTNDSLSPDAWAAKPHASSVTRGCFGEKDRRCRQRWCAGRGPSGVRIFHQLNAGGAQSSVPSLGGSPAAPTRDGADPEQSLSSGV